MHPAPVLGSLGKSDTSPRPSPHLPTSDNKSFTGDFLWKSNVRDGRGPAYNALCVKPSQINTPSIAANVNAQGLLVEEFSKRAPFLT
jgi:hypothetical protein